jgi:hypothetical protein
MVETKTGADRPASALMNPKSRPFVLSCLAEAILLVQTRCVKIFPATLRAPEGNLLDSSASKKALVVLSLRTMETIAHCLSKSPFEQYDIRTLRSPRSACSLKCSSLLQGLGDLDPSVHFIGVLCQGRMLGNFLAVGLIGASSGPQPASVPGRFSSPHGLASSSRSSSAVSI